jgi:hypothetical protein
MRLMTVFVKFLLNSNLCVEHDECDELDILWTEFHFKM